MRSLAPDELPALRPLLGDERPGPLVGPHLLATGCGGAWVDRWPDARVAVVCAGDGMALRGEAGRLDPAELGTLVSELAGEWNNVMIEAPDVFVPTLRAAVETLWRWPRIISALYREPPSLPAPPDAALRRVAPADADALAGLAEDVAWIADTVGGPAGLATRGRAWLAFVGERLAAVAAPFFEGERYEDIGVVTEADLRGRGLSSACAARLAVDVRAREHTPCWSTSPDNRASLAVAARLGFEKDRDDVLYVAGEPFEGVEPVA